jgi:protein pelota
MENDDDMWNLYNLVSKGDFVQGKTSRKVAVEGAIGAERKTFTIMLKVQDLEYDPDSNIIRINGKNVAENKYVQVGQFQSMEFNSSSVVTLVKVCRKKKELSRGIGTTSTRIG